MAGLARQHAEIKGRDRTLVAVAELPFRADQPLRDAGLRHALAGPACRDVGGWKVEARRSSGRSGLASNDRDGNTLLHEVGRCHHSDGTRPHHQHPISIHPHPRLTYLNRH